MKKCCPLLREKKNCYHCSIQCLQACVFGTTTLDVATAIWSCDSVMGCDWFSLELVKMDPREFRLKYAANLLPHGVSSIISARLGRNCEYADIFQRYSVENSYQNISNSSLKSTYNKYKYSESKSNKHHITDKSTMAIHKMTQQKLCLSCPHWHIVTGVWLLGWFLQFLYFMLRFQFIQTRFPQGPSLRPCGTPQVCRQVVWLWPHCQHRVLALMEVR